MAKFTVKVITAIEFTVEAEEISEAVRMGRLALLKP